MVTARDRPVGSDRKGELPGLVQAGGAEGLRPGGGGLALLLVPGVREGLRGRDPGRPGLRHRLLGHRHEPVVPDLVSSGPRRAQARGRSDGEGQDGRKPHAARARLHRGRGRLLQGFGSPRPPHVRRRLREGDGAGVHPLSSRSGGAGLLRPRPPGHRRSSRPHLRQAEAIRGDRREDLRRAAGSPRRRALHHPRLRLPRPRAAGAARGGALREVRPLGAACAPHAVAHLRAPRHVVRDHPGQHRRGGGGEGPRQSR